MKAEETREAANPTPWNPGSGYVLDWEYPAQYGNDPAQPQPQDWVKHYNTGRVRVVRKSEGAPVRSGECSARFELIKGDPPIKGGARSELAVATAEQPDAATKTWERWYGFSIYLPIGWAKDRSGEIVTQWHHDLPGGSPPLAIVTRNGQWEISQNWEGFFSNVRIGSYQDDLDRWTDWVVHVIWSAGDTGKLTIWKNGKTVNGFDPERNQEVSFDDKPGKNTYENVGNYMKIGIYKWDWSQGNPSDTTQRVMYHDKVRIADRTGSFDKPRVLIEPRVQLPYPPVAKTYKIRAVDPYTGVDVPAGVKVYNPYNPSQPVVVINTRTNQEFTIKFVAIRGKVMYLPLIEVTADVNPRKYKPVWLVPGQQPPTSASLSNPYPPN